MVAIDLGKLYKPHPRQVLFHQSPHKGRLFGGAIRGGKTKAGVAEGIQLSIDYPGNVGLMARQTLPAFKRTVLVELERYFDAGVHVDGIYKKLITQHHSTDHFIQFWNGSKIWYTGLGDDTHGLVSQMGITLGWFFIDQVEECSEMHFNNLLGRLSLQLKDIRYKYFLTANPMPGWVKQRFIESKPDDFIYIPSLPKDNPYLPPNYEQELREIYPKELAEAWLDGNWDVMESGNYLFSWNEITRAVDKDVPAEGELFMGVDFAWSSGDENVAIIRQGGKMLSFDRWILKMEDSLQSVDRVIELINRFKIPHKNVRVDAVSGGSPLYSGLVVKGYNVTPIIAGATADDEEHYTNKRAEMFYQLQARFRKDEISIVDDRDLKAQLATIKYKPAQEKKMQLISKEEMRSHGEHSPDRADALALAFYTPKQNNPNLRWL
jgi:hypothetical protein